MKGHQDQIGKTCHKFALVNINANLEIIIYYVNKVIQTPLQFDLRNLLQHPKMIKKLSPYKCFKTKVWIPTS